MPPGGGDGGAAISGPLLRLLIIVFITAAAMSMLGPLVMILLQDKFTSDVVVLAAAYIPAAVVNSFLPSRLGRLSDRFGRGPMIAIGFVASGLGSPILPVLPGIGWLVLLWTLETLGWVVAAPAQEALVADVTERDARGSGYGLYSFAGSVGGIFGPLLGGWLYDAVGHGAPFYLTGMVMLASAAWALALLPGRRARPEGD